VEVGIRVIKVWRGGHMNESVKTLFRLYEQVYWGDDTATGTNISTAKIKTPSTFSPLSFLNFQIYFAF
jgi:hypothetical protein